MAIPDVTREQLIAALELFDQELRQSADWIGWEQKENHKYAIEHGGRRYPVKHIIALATNSGTNTFSGGDEANTYLRKRGFEVVLLDRAAHADSSTEITFDRDALAGLIRRFTDRYGSFTSQAYLEDERNYKLEAAKRMYELLNESRLSGLIKRREFDTAHADIRRAYSSNNLLNQWDVLPVVNAASEPLVHRLYTLLHGASPFEQRFTAWIELLQKETATCWPAATYYLMLHDPQRHIFVKPEPYRSLFRAIHTNLRWEPHPSAASYRRIQRLGEQLLTELMPLGARDMIDVQSFIWFVREKPNTDNIAESGAPYAAAAPRSYSMARLSEPHAQRIYAAAERFINAALRHDDSLFTPGRAIWTAANLDELYRHFVLQPDEGAGDFWSKLKGQLVGVSAHTYQLAAEMLYLHFLPASRSVMTGPIKRAKLQQVLDWSPEPGGAIPLDLAATLDEGLAAMGAAYHIFRWRLFEFLIEFARAWKALPAQEQERLLNDPWAFKSMLFSVSMKSAYSQREILLHLIHPETFEPIASRDHKRKITQTFERYVTQPTDDIDRRLTQIRQRLAQHYGVNFHFYWPEIYKQWNGNGEVEVTTAPSPFDALGSDLRSYIRFAISLGSATYTPEEMVDLFGRINPHVAKSTSAPDPDNLVTDLMLLRLLEPLDDGRYRRWPHLADATEAHMLRYAALTLILPVAGEDTAYVLPIEQVPQDGGVHPASEWPGGEALLRWYEQAELVQRVADGWQLRPDALEPLDATTPTAQAINTFLGNLRRVWRSNAATPSLQSEGLPVLDPATLDARIAEIQRDLLIDRPTILRIYRSLIAGRHVILSGPPGTGKTHLARILPRILWRDESRVWLSLPARPEQSPTDEPQPVPLVQQGYAVDVVTATEDWGTRHVIGGIVPQLEQNGNGRSLVYGVRHGVLTRTVLQNYGGDGETIPDTLIPSRQPITIGTEQYRGRWLVIDEFTRAPIDAAFGSLLTTLGGQSNPKLAVPTDAGIDRDIPLPSDFRLIGTLNSFDRHFLNQISEAMKRRFTFIDVLPPSRELGATEQAMAIYRALLSLQANHLGNITADEHAGRASWADVLNVRREHMPDDPLTRVRYMVDVADSEANTAIDGFWRLFEAIRVYRQLGTAQAESVYATIFAGRSIGMTWQEALDSALADVLADQLQVLARDEQRVLVSLIEHHDNVAAFTDAVKKILRLMPGPRQLSHLAQLRSADVATARSIDDTDSSKLQPEHLSDLFRFGVPLDLPQHGLFVRRMYAFINEKGL